MKNRSRRTRYVRAAVFILAAFVSTAGMAQVFNTGTGDISGVPGDLTDSQPFELNLTTLTLVKTAFLMDGTALATGAQVPAGTQVQFMIYVDNPTSVLVSDINVQDVLDGAFTYVPDSIKVAATADTNDTEADIYTAVSGTIALDDGLDLTDVAGWNGTTTISAGTGTGNVQADIPALKVWAILFTVQM